MEVNVEAGPGWQAQVPVLDFFMWRKPFSAQHLHFVAWIGLGKAFFQGLTANPIFL